MDLRMRTLPFRVEPRRVSNEVLQSGGRLETYASEMLEALADVFEVNSMDELLERDSAPSSRSAAKGKRRR